MLIAFIINSIIVAAAVLVHYEMLYHLSLILPKLKVRRRYRVVLGIFGTMVAHIMEIWMFAFGYYFMIKAGNFGTLQGKFELNLLDCVYFSFVAYSSLGLGDIYPAGWLRFLTGLETLTGLVLITWTASFMFIEMQKFWKD